MFKFGEYQPDYNPKIHGTYDPARYYGKPDTPFGEVKLRDLGSWFGRREKSPQAFTQLVSRAWWRWQHKYMFPKNALFVGPMQLVFGGMAFFYWINYGKLKHHTNFKYH